MVASQSAAREEESHQHRRRESVNSSKQRESPTTTDADLASAIEQLPSHIQPMVTLLAKMVSPSIKGRMMEKRGKDALEQAANMMALCRSFASSLCIFLLFNAERNGSGLGSPGLFPTS